MRFLIDNNLSPLLADRLKAAGHDVVHVRDVGLQASTDSAVLERARIENRVLISADTDFGSLLARSHSLSPSVLLIPATYRPPSGGPVRDHPGQSPIGR